jgi:hypothetical protein
VKGSNTFGQRYATQAATNRALANTASITVERYFTVTAEGNGESFNIQSNTPSAGNKIVRKIWYKDEAFEATDVNTWTLLHTFADDTTYANTATKWQEYLDGQTYGKPPFTLAISWEDVPAVTGILHGLTADLTYAYAPAWLNTSYTGNCIRVRRASDNTEQNIGFDGQDLDTAALTTFCTGTNCFLRTVYDQSGNGYDVVQTTTANQPKIYDSSTGVLLSGGLAAFDFNSANSQRLAATSNVSAGTPHFFGIHELSAGAYAGAINADNTYIYDFTTRLELRQNSSQFTTTTTAARTRKMWNWLNDGSNSKAAVNNDAYTTATQTKATLLSPRLGTNGTQNLFGTLKIQAFIGYTADKSSDRTAIETALNDYFNVY